MTAYLVVEVTTTDREKFKEYETGAVQVAAKHGGVPIAKDTDPLPIERTDPPEMAVILRFPDKQAVRDYFDSPEYAPLRTLRQSVSQAHALVIES